MDSGDFILKLAIFKQKMLPKYFEQSKTKYLHRPQFNVLNVAKNLLHMIKFICKEIL